MWHKREGSHLVEPNDTRFWNNIWKSQIFKSLLDDPKLGYGAVVDKFKQWPSWWIESQYPDEREHFGIWFGRAFIYRTYENNFIHDMYLFHDILHSVSFKDQPEDSFGEWALKMRANEIGVSLETEVGLYLRKPDLREEIWADLWLNPQMRPLLESRAHIWKSTLGQKSYEQQLWGQQPLLGLPFHGLEETLWFARRHATYVPQNHIEKYFLFYEDRAELDYQFWKPYWKDVELHRLSFQRLCRQEKFKEAIELRHDFWNIHSDKRGVPFGKVSLGQYQQNQSLKAKF